MLLGSEHKERYDEMEGEINFRSTDFWFMRSPDAPKDEELNHLVDFLLREFIHVGPFGSTFVKEDQSKWKSHFYGVPLQHLFIHPSTDSFEAMAFVANNSAASVLMKGVFDYLRQYDKLALFKQLGLSVMAVQRARAASSEMQIVVGMDVLTQLEPLSIYEHPVNGRLLMAMQGEEVPDVCALSMKGKRMHVNRNVHDLYMDASSIYNDFEMGDIEERELIVELFQLYKG
ncbi:hypothetical protein AVU38_gp202 [Ralstonia phage RSL2]|uniref:Uncharacterized protein n=1 Tax=Ralstonia phage RSL2 TaxID=1585840 RepID=A0A0A8J8H7_9CAUD|nr:hypothetical protein AVU38_gp202 [Ralstonia phage RSL2]BAQ02730.1 hypothetical protein [Ralstonia phage RSL2]